MDCRNCGNHAELYFTEYGKGRVPMCRNCATMKSDFGSAESIATVDRRERPEQVEAQIAPAGASPCICDFPGGSATIAQREAAEGHYNQAGGFCCPHHGNTCGYCHQYDG